jgi:Polyketide cyclase / dehydrase and lipid transport
MARKPHNPLALRLALFAFGPEFSARSIACKPGSLRKGGHRHQCAGAFAEVGATPLEGWAPSHAVIRACAAAVAAAVPAVSVAVLALACARADAASIETLTTKHDAGRYAVSLRAHLDASALAAYALFADVANWKRLSPDLRRLEILDQQRDGAMELSTAFQACVLWYCRVIYGMSDVFFTQRADGGDIYLMLRNVGDFRSGEAHWRLRGSSSGTELQFTAEVEPAFTVPPIIGPWLMARWLRSEALQTSLNVEALAREAAAGRSTDGNGSPRNSVLPSDRRNSGDPEQLRTGEADR